MRATRAAQRVTAPTSRGRRLVSVVRHIADTAALTTLWRATPAIDVDLNSHTSPFASGLRDAQRLAGPLTQPVSLLTIGEIDDYLRGRPKQALRTNVRKAHELGCRCEEVETAADIRSLNALVQRRWKGELEPLWPDPNNLIVTCRGTDEPVVLVRVWIQERWALLSCFVRLDQRPATSPFRHAAQLATVDLLRRRRVRYFVAGPALTISESLQYCHHLWGFEPIRLRWARPEAG